MARCFPYLVRYKNREGTWHDGPRYGFPRTAVPAARLVAERNGYADWTVEYLPVCACHPLLRTAEGEPWPSTKESE